jgi:hypothetical protein
MTNSLRFLSGSFIGRWCLRDFAKRTLESVIALIRPKLSGCFYEALVLGFLSGLLWHELNLNCFATHGEVRHE